MGCQPSPLSPEKLQKPEGSKATRAAMQAVPSGCSIEVTVTSRSLRPRSPEREHIDRHVEQYGTLKFAAKKCNRCKFYKNRKQWLPKLTFMNSLGKQEVAIAENPDPMAEWGLICMPCVGNPFPVEKR